MKKPIALSLLILAGLYACKDDDEIPEKLEAPKPMVDFDFEQTDEVDPFTYSFSSTVENSAEIRWEFGDDSVAFEPNPVHTYALAGKYRALLRGINEDGYWAEKEVWIDINADSVINFVASPQPDGSLKFELIAEIEVESMFWDFGNGSTSEEFSPQTTYESGKFFDVVLTARTPKGSQAVARRLVCDIGIIRDLTNVGRFTVSRDNNGGADATEGSKKLIDGKSDTKFLQFDYVGDLWTQLEFPDPVKVGAYTLTSANDDYGRDPKDWVLEGSNDGQTWTAVDQRSGENFEERFQTKTYIFENDVAYTFYRMRFTANEGAGIFQLAEWRLLQLPE